MWVVGYIVVCYFAVAFVCLSNCVFAALSLLVLCFPLLLLVLNIVVCCGFFVVFARLPILLARLLFLASCFSLRGCRCIVPQQIRG